MTVEINPEIILSNLGGNGSQIGGKPKKKEKPVNFLENLEITVRSKKETRRLGPAISSRIIGFFRSEDPDDIVAA